MEDLKLVIASNIINLRTNANMTQLELAKMLNYSDKSISKWERAEGMPDACVLKRLSEIFSVTVDYLLNMHDEWRATPKKESTFRTKVATTIAVCCVCTAAMLIFVVMWLFGKVVWQVFVAAIPLAILTLLIFNSVWEQGRNNCWIIAALIFSIIAGLYLMFYKNNWWQILLLIAPAELIVFLCSRVKKRRK